jgi:hypothetical protein
VAVPRIHRKRKEGERESGPKPFARPAGHPFFFAALDHAGRPIKPPSPVMDMPARPVVDMIPPIDCCNPQRDLRSIMLRRWTVLSCLTATRQLTEDDGAWALEIIKLRSNRAEGFEATIQGALSWIFVAHIRTFARGVSGANFRAPVSL